MKKTLVIVFVSLVSGYAGAYFFNLINDKTPDKNSGIELVQNISTTIYLIFVSKGSIESS